MRRIFVSYSSKVAEAVAPLIADLKKLGHSVWFDEHLHVGARWWEHILNQIRECDLMVCVIEDHALRSVACKREREYGTALRKGILPVAIGEKPRLLPPDLAELQILEYRHDDRELVFQLVEGISKAPPAGPLPDPLPPAPEPPLSHLSKLVALVGEDELTYAQEAALVAELRDYLRNPQSQDEIDDAIEVVHRLRQRRDIRKSTDIELQELLKRAGTVDARNAREQEEQGKESPEVLDERGGESESKRKRKRRFFVSVSIVVTFGVGSGGFLSLLTWKSPEPEEPPVIQVIRFRGSMDRDANVGALSARLAEKGYRVPAAYVRDAAVEGTFVRYFRREDVALAESTLDIVLQTLDAQGCTRSARATTVWESELVFASPGVLAIDLYENCRTAAAE